jgi:two-component system sensor histidine kinase/response regulator
VLDISKIEADKLTFETADVDLEELIESVVQMLSPLAAAKGLRLIADISASVASRVEVDPLRLKQVLFNLGSNAIKFTESGADKPGRVFIGVDLQLGDGERPDLLSLRVQDNGIGMSESTLQLIFEPFVQADASNTRRFGGTGLGLAIVRRLCDVAGGRVTVTSQEGIGSEFSVSWPIKVLEPKPRERVLSAVDALVISADPELAALQARYLAEAGARARTLDPRELPDNDSFKPDLIILNDESESLARVRSKWSETPIVSVARDASTDTPRALLKNHVACGAPILRSPLMAAALVALGKASQPRERFESRRPAISKAPSLQRAEASGRLILVVEDNEVNRDLIRRQLEFLGYACELATNGRDALEHMTQRRYGLVLTDCHMPELDGFELTRAIREQEQAQAASTPLPIVAITANAMAGEAERCKAAGMSDWLSKPVELNRLRATVERWLLAERGAAVRAVDPEVLAELVGGDPAHNAELYRRFVSHARELVKVIEQASHQGDARHASEQAHKLKSSSASVGAGVMSHLAAQIELAGGADDHAQLSELCSRLQAEMQRVADEIDAILTAASEPRPTVRAR